MPTRDLPGSEASDNGRPVMTLGEALQRGAKVYALLDCKVYELEVPEALGPGERVVDGEVLYSAAWLDESSGLSNESGLSGPQPVTGRVEVFDT